MTNETQQSSTFNLETLYQALPKLSDNNLPPVLAQQDMLRIIGHMLPMYHFSGSKFNLNRVCKQWKAEFEAPLWNYKKSKQALNQCAKQAEDGLVLLSDFSLCSQMSMERILKLASQQEELVHAILDDTEILKLLESSEVALLACSKEFVALMLLSIPAFREVCTTDDLALIAAHHAPICYDFMIEIIKNRQVYGKNFESRHLVMLARYHQGCAVNLLASTSLQQLLSFDEVVQISARHKLIAQELLSKEKLHAQITSAHLCSLAQCDEEIALLILQNKKWVALLSDYEIAAIACRYENACDYVLKTPALCEQLKSDSIVKLGSVSARVADKILKSELAKLLSDDEHIELYSYHLPLALRLVKSLTKLSLTAEHLFILCKRQPQIAKIVFENPDLFSKLKSHHLIEIAKINVAASTHICRGDQQNVSKEEIAQMKRKIKLCRKISQLANSFYEKSLTCDPTKPKVLC